MRKSFTVDVYPEDLKSKVYLLKHFEKYIMDRLYGEYEYTFEDVAREKGMEWVQKYLRMKNLIVFKLSHDVLQVRFLISTSFILLTLLRFLLRRLCSSISTTTPSSSSHRTGYSSPTSTNTIK